MPTDPGALFIYFILGSSLIVGTATFVKLWRDDKRFRPWK